MKQSEDRNGSLLDQVSHGITTDIGRKFTGLVDSFWRLFSIIQRRPHLIWKCVAAHAKNEVSFISSSLPFADADEAIFPNFYSAKSRVIKINIYQ
ncbi:hypothetical protein [Sporolactobacillus sp. KGMB 08714]|uniref:hypothetical protein n=1 Tax=Sporolactobacillus sp. KGMB 08714 TaxID=3064704 RepID=UPI002FBE5A6C